MKMKINILHIASFNGNIGDNANHLGFRNTLNLLYPKFKFEFTEFEIRTTFRKEGSFDNEGFVNLANQHDLVFFGGGNFFELWVDHSCNNTSVNIPLKRLKKIKIPIIFYALGFDISMGFSDKGISKFCSWLDYVIEREDFVLSLRNDGSLKTMQKTLPKKYHQYFKKIPDGGFFIHKLIESIHSKTSSNQLIGINIAGDMLDIRYDQSASSINYTSFLGEFTSMIHKLLEKNPHLKIKFFPHIYKDYKVINDILNIINEKYARERILVHHYASGDEFTLNTFQAYKECDLILGNRFHSNVCAISLSIPSIGLLNYSQIEYLYNDLNLDDRVVDIRKKGFSILLAQKIKDNLNRNHLIEKQYGHIVEKLHLELSFFLKKIINSVK
jgi:polysaccharide pyruvyl transferase WcaK-like protein